MIADRPPRMTDDLAEYLVELRRLRRLMRLAVKELHERQATAETISDLATARIWRNAALVVADILEIRPS